MQRGKYRGKKWKLVVEEIVSQFKIEIRKIIIVEIEEIIKDIVEENFFKL